MDVFYAEVLGGGTAGEALHAAQLRFKSGGYGVDAWGAFTCDGGSRRQ